MDFTFEATDLRSGRRHTIDRRWQKSEPATAPLNLSGSYHCDDERMYKTPDGDYVLVWRTDLYRQYYECEYMPERDARDWFARQGKPPDEQRMAQQEPAPTLDIQSYRSLREFGRSVYKALQRVSCAASNLCRDDLGLEWDADAPAIGPAVAELAAVMQVIRDADDWINTPNGADNLVNTLFAIERETRLLVIKVGDSLKPLSWKGDFKTLHTLENFLEREIAGLESIPELERELYAEELAKLQEQPQYPASEAAGEIDYRWLWEAAYEARAREVEAAASEAETLEPATDQAEPATEALRRAGAVLQSNRAFKAEFQATLSAACEALGGEPAPSSKEAVGPTPKRLWTLEEAEFEVDAYLKKHPQATLNEIKRDTGVSKGTAGKTKAYRRKHPKKKRRSRSVPLTEKILAMASKVAGPDVDLEALKARCEADPAYRRNLEVAYGEYVDHESQFEHGRRPQT